ncbi:hypothetical protein JOF56_009950 [Kibdelosporangium banguiense]|uniref:Uncharacterized protein n=1 Tax=Kibdelosporangium banguiense TaxID=1365924 RepID=A0ABS4TYU1_9PSEU|nr:hypothetical protein [Kibdelosporangium banguiense]MBP2329565.1 hypothetical protein [Kibdelosporangium banguiense]
MTIAPLNTPSTFDPAWKGTNEMYEMLLYEILARTRMREAEQFAHHHRVARRLHSSRRWCRLAKWAKQKAERAERSL